MKTATPSPIPKTGAGPQSSSAASQQCNEEFAAIEVANAAAKAAGLTAPPIMVLGAHLADLIHADAAFADIQDAEAGSARVLASWAGDLLDDRIDAMREVIATQQATTLPEAAVQIAVLAYFIAGMPDGGSGPNGERINHLVAAMERLALSVLPIVTRAAGLDAEAMGWADYAGSMRVARFAVLGVQS